MTECPSTQAAREMLEYERLMVRFLADHPSKYFEGLDIDPGEVALQWQAYFTPDDDASCYHPLFNGYWFCGFCEHIENTDSDINRAWHEERSRLDKWANAKGLSDDDIRVVIRCKIESALRLFVIDELWMHCYQNCLLISPEGNQRAEQIAALRNA